MVNITKTILANAIHNNDYDKLKNLLEEDSIFLNNDHGFVGYYLLEKCIQMKNIKCFDIILDYWAPNNYFPQEIEEIYKLAVKVYNKGKNEDNKHFIKKLLKDHISIEPDYIPDIINIDIDLYNKYFDEIKNDKNKIYELLDVLVKDNTFTYFLDIFNNYLDNNEQIKYVYDNIYNKRIVKDNLSPYVVSDYSKHNQAFNYFINNPNFDYNKLMISSDNHVIYSIALNCKFIPTCLINYVNNNPLDVTNNKHFINYAPYMLIYCFYDTYYNNKKNNCRYNLINL